MMVIFWKLMDLVSAVIPLVLLVMEGLILIACHATLVISCIGLVNVSPIVHPLLLQVGLSVNSLAQMVSFCIGTIHVEQLVMLHMFKIQLMVNNIVTSLVPSTLSFTLSTILHASHLALPLLTLSITLEELIIVNGLAWSVNTIMRMAPVLIAAQLP